MLKAMNDIHDLPYELHTGRELELMLGGIKPLASFVDEYPADPREWLIPELAFGPHVLDGSVERREFVELMDRPPPPHRSHLKGIRRVLYALPNESWRIDAYIAMLARGQAEGWSDELERLEGRLLGYEDWQTDAWIDMLLARPNASRIPWLSRLADKRRPRT